MSWLCLLDISTATLALVIPNHHRIPSDIARHFREIYGKVHNALWRVGSQVVSCKQLTGSCITLFRTPARHVNSAIKIQNPFHVISNVATPHCNWPLNGILESNSACLYDDDHRSMLQVFSCCRKSGTAPQLNAMQRQLRSLHHILFCFLHI